MRQKNKTNVRRKKTNVKNKENGINVKEEKNGEHVNEIKISAEGKGRGGDIKECTNKKAVDLA